MKYLRIILILIFVSLLQYCSSSSYIDTENPDINISEDIDSVNIAILPFSKHGPFLPSYSGVLFAEMLADELFLSDKYLVIHKSKTKEVFKELEIQKPTNLDYSVLKNIGTRLNAKYVITGNILQYTDSELIGLESDYKIKVTCRVLSTESGDIVGLISILSNSKNANAVDVLDSIAKKIIRNLNNDN